jgi:hypothetical protein
MPDSHPRSGSNSRSGLRSAPPERGASGNQKSIVPPRKVSGRVVQVLAATDTRPKAFQSSEQPCLTFDFEGIVGNRRRGWTRSADARVPYLKRGSEMRNTRHVTIVSREDLADIASRLDLAHCEPSTLGANIVVDGVPNLSFLPRGTRLLFEGGAILSVEDQNEPCILTGAALRAANPGRDDLQLLFPKRAIGLRGLLATVEYPGILRPNSEFIARLPKQWIY